MPTEKPKISLYVPSAIYDRFIEYQEQSGLSMSQAGIVILAEYFGMEETIKEITRRTTVGGVTLDRVEAIEQELKELKQHIEQLVTEKPDNAQLVSHHLPSNTYQHELPF